MTQTPLGPDRTPEVATAEVPRTRLAEHFRRNYGAGPVHLLLILVSFVVALIACRKVYDADSMFWWRYAIWFVGAAIFHDLLLAPFYIAVDQLMKLVHHKVPTLSPDRINYVRFPAVISGVLLLVFLPTITKHSPDTFRFAAGKGLDAPYFLRWVLITVGLFVGSGIVYAVGRLRAARRS